MAPAFTSCWRFSSASGVRPARPHGRILELTRMRHVQQSPRSIPLYTHVPGLGQPRKWAQSTRSRNLGLVLFMRSEVRYAPDSVALNFDICRQHLADKGREPSKLHNKDLVVRCWTRQILVWGRHISRHLLLTARLPRAALAARCTSMSEL